MIDHIEILRDGAAAQYGSDAIAGVINIVLKSDAPGALHVRGRRELHDVQPRRDLDSSRSPAQTDARVGARRRSVHDVVELRVVVRRKTDSCSSAARCANRADKSHAPRHAPAVLRRRSAQRERARDAFLAGRLVQSRHARLFLNAGQTSARRRALWRSAGTAVARRVGRHVASSERRSHRPRDLSGRLPPVHQVRHRRCVAAVGLKGDAARLDSGTSARCTAETRSQFTIDNSANVSLGNASKTSFDAGKLRFDQSTTTFDLVP